MLSGLSLSRRCVTLKKECRKILKSPTIRKMSGWKVEKERYLSMDLEEKRKHYNVREYKTLKEIPTWKEYANRPSLGDKIPALADFKIDKSHNAALADKISIFVGNITALEIDAIVNAANTTLRGGGGVDGAIHTAADHKLLVQECMTLKGCQVGEAKLTGGYKLPAKYIIHTVGPRGEKPELLQKCYKNSLDIVTLKKFRSVAFPCISTGIYDYPLLPAAHIAAKEVRKYLEVHSHDIDRIIFCLFNTPDVKVYNGILQSYFPID